MPSFNVSRAAFKITVSRHPLLIRASQDYDYPATKTAIESKMIEKRKFTRIVFSRPAAISDGVHTWPCKLIDLSLKGALVEKPEQWEYRDDAEYRLSFSLADSDIEVTMDVDMAHQQEDVLGFNCVQIDIDSVSHLKRLVELNVGSDKLLHRELAQLSHPMPL